MIMDVNSEPTVDVELLKEAGFQYQIQDASGISDEAIRIFMFVTYGVLCQMFSVFGIVTNIINFICFIKQGFKDSVNISLLGLAISDFGCLITMIGINGLCNPGVLSIDLEIDVMDFTYMIFTIPHMTFSVASSWITAVITLERCLCVIAPLKIKSFVSPKKMFLAIAIIYVILLLSTVPFYAVNTLGMKFSLLRNKTLLSRILMNNQEKVESVSYSVNNFATPMTAFSIILICTITLAIKLQRGTAWRKKSTSSAQVDRVSSRNQKVAKMVVMISAVFIVCFTPVCTIMLVAAYEPAMSITGKYFKIGVIAGGLGFILESINSSCNIFIYFHMSSKYRETFLNTFRRSVYKKG